MMAARFRSVTWVAVAVVPALACYLVTQHVAAERASLAKVERQIGQTRRAIRDLETELGTRGSMAQIERWNGQTFALAAPSAEQFVASDVQLASLTALPPLPRPGIPGAVVQAVASASSATPKVDAPVRSTALPAAPAQAEMRQASFRPASPRTDEAHGPAFRMAAASASTPRAEGEQATLKQAAFKPARRAEPVEAEPQPLLRQATYTKPARDKVAPTKVALLANGPLGAGTLADIGRIANAERGSRRP